MTERNTSLLGTYAARIDRTTFGTVKQYYRSPTSEIDHVVLVEGLHTLEEAALLFFAEHSRPASLITLAYVEEGSFRFAVDSVEKLAPKCRTHAVTLASIDDKTPCDVLYEPPVYFVKMVA